MQVGLAYSCDGLPVFAIGALLGQLLTSSASQPAVQSQVRSNGRGVRVADGDSDGPISRECCWANADTFQGGLLGNVQAPPQYQRQRHLPLNCPSAVLMPNRMQVPGAVVGSTPVGTNVSLHQTPLARPAANTSAASKSFDNSAAAAAGKQQSNIESNDFSAGQVVKDGNSNSAAFGDKFVKATGPVEVAVTSEVDSASIASRKAQEDKISEAKPTKPSKPVKIGNCENQTSAL